MVSRSTHAPLPSQVSGLFELAFPATQDAARHCTPLAKREHERAPLQKPVRPQVDWGCAGHSLSGFWPSGTAVQAPWVPASLQLSQVPLQAVSQQKPSVQKVLAHSLPMPHVWPSDFLQMPDEHW